MELKAGTPAPVVLHSINNVVYPRKVFLRKLFWGTRKLKIMEGMVMDCHAFHFMQKCKKMCKMVYKILKIFKNLAKFLHKTLEK